MKLKKFFVITTVISTLLFPNTIKADTIKIVNPKDEYKTMYVTSTDGLNVRKGGSVECEKIGALPYRTKIEVKYISKDNWAIFDYEGMSQFVCADWLSEEMPPEEEKEINLPNTYNSNTASYNGNLTYYANCRITHYCSCSICCGKWAAYAGTTASGAPAAAGTTIAMDLPFGTQVSINGHIYTVQDRGVSGAAVDIYCNSHSEALAGGMYYADVYIVG